ncbi:MAG: peptidylprolyl isomerase [Actinomycetota bacterium]
MKRLIIIAAAAAFALTACSEAAPTTTPTTAAPATTASTATPATTTTTLPEVPLDVVPRDYAGFLAQQPACGASAPAPVTPMEFDAPADMGLDSAAPATVVMSTSCGDITIELESSIASATANSFAFLASEGYFDGTVVHRLIPGYIVQGGDPTASGMGGPGYTIPDEFPPAGTLYERGMIAMANAGPGTGGSQFFIMLGDAELPPQYTIFGRVTDGLDVLDQIERTRLGQAPGSPDPVPSTPLETIYVNTATLDG